MKYLAVSFFLAVVYSFAISAEIPADLAEMVDEYESGMRIFGVNDDDYEDDNDNEFFLLKFETQLDTTKKDPGYVVRVTVQLFDKKTDQWVFAQEEEPLEVYSKSGTGKTTLSFEIPYGEMNRPKMEACAIELGFKKNGKFIPVVTEYDGVDSAEEIVNGKGLKVKMVCSEHTVWYKD